MRHLVQLLIPEFDNEGHPLDPAPFAETRRELMERFGGLTAYTRAPAQGVWRSDDGRVARDEVVIVEVMVEALEPEWWQAYRRTLEARFRQEAVVIRAIGIQVL